MLLRGKRVEELSVEDILSLIDSRIPESLILDYKRDFKLKDDSDRSELLADITSFHNTEGGIILFGLEDEKDELKQNTGLPRLPSKNGVLIDNYDKTKIQIEDIIKNNTDPQLNSLYFSNLLIVNDCKVFAISIPKNFSLPTRINFRNSSKFYRRRNTGKYLLDTNEIYQMFLKNSNSEEKASVFLKQREDIVFERSPIPQIYNVPFLFMHIIPIGGQGAFTIDAFSSDDFNTTIKDCFPPLGFEQKQHLHYSLDGLYLTYSRQNRYNNHKHINVGYNLLFRNGVIESMCTEMFNDYLEATAQIILHADELFKCISKLITKTFEFYNKYAIELPYILSISLINIPNVTLVHNGGIVLGHLVDNPNIKFPPFTIYDVNRDIRGAIIYVFDVICQAAGLARCPDKIRNFISANEFIKL